MIKSAWLLIALQTVIIFNTYGQIRSLDFDPQLAPFYHGVASGDPSNDGFIIWTRVSPEPNQTNSISGTWKIAADSSMQQMVKSGVFSTDSSIDYTVKIRIDGLQPGQFYYYEFESNGRYSLVGRSKTAPIGDNDSLRFAVVSCAHYEAGYFNVYEAIRKRNDIDAVIHLGDYIYEYGRGEYGQFFINDREYEPSGEAMDLNSYRTRYSQYRLDADLRRLHQQYPMMIVWDDHESANNSYADGAQNHDSNEGIWEDRKLASIKAFHEWLPISQVDSNDNKRIFRNIKYGDLASIIFLDTRLYGRDVQMNFTNSSIQDSNRTILGSYQENWLFNALKDSSTQWKIVAQQVMMAPLKIVSNNNLSFVNEDQWDGYPKARERLANFVIDSGIQNFVVATGDIHTSWANDLPLDNYNSNTGNGSYGVEFVTPSVTSPGLSFNLPPSFIQATNPHTKFVNTLDKGFIILDVNKTRCQAEWYHINSIQFKTSQTSHATSAYVINNERHLNITQSISLASKNHSAPFGPDIPNNPSYINENNNPTLLSIYPNPVKDLLHLQLIINQNSTLNKIQCFDGLGKQVFFKVITQPTNGLKNITINTAPLESGNYIITMVGDKFKYSRQFVKH